DGTETYEKWELHVHKRVVDVGMNERALRQIMRVDVPDSVNIEIELKE
ncbi:MAG: 30S ribosomal protein S10, partial [Candidatus Aenigmarchaeota archaeon]|nr:30S ribosomal protein S10 [Candidatus Aenigmarchaeota archaeon]